MAQLRFGFALGPAPGGAVALRFGALNTGGVIDPPMITPTIGAARRAGARLQWRLADRLAAAQAGLPWAAAARTGVASVAAWRTAAAAATVAGAPWRGAEGLGIGRAMPWVGRSAGSAATRAPWQGAEVLRQAWLARWHDAVRARQAAGLPWGFGQAAVVDPRLAWAVPGASRLPISLAARGASAVRTGPGLPWRTGVQLISLGGPWVSPVTPPIVITPCYTPSTALRFKAEWSSLTRLLFSCGHITPALVRVPVQRVYMVTNTTTLVRVSDGASIPCLGLSLSLDVDSWAWGFSASLPADALSMIDPDSAGSAVELLATVNGTGFRLLVEAVARERTFGQVGVRVQGRGRTALLADPYYPIEVFSNAGGARTSQQLIDDALPSGWSADWGLTAWLVPAGVWQHQGTPLTAALAVAQAGGGYLQPHPTDLVLSVLPRYPLAPWDWAGATPDFELPAAVMQREAIDWLDKPVYNRVYVSGVGAGVLGRVTRTGTAGDLVAQMVTDALITHTDAARQRGLPVLADTGAQARVTLRLPVLSATGILRPGHLVRYVDGSATRTGLVRAVSVEASLPEVWQTITVETHL